MKAMMSRRAIQRLFPAAAAVSTAIMLTALTAAAQDKPLPNVEALRQRAIEQSAATEKLRERYLCRIRMETDELDKNGAVKKTEVDEREIFFVKARQISQVVTKNGKPLSDSEAKKEIDHVKKQIEDAEKGKADPNGISQSQVLRLFKLNNERRISFSGRPTILFDGVGDPAAKASGIAEHAAQAMAGTIAIDEQTGRVADTNVRGVRDVKMGGGIVADIHKGFQLHIISAPRADGVWLIQEAWGSGDARVGLFLHPSYRFHQVTESCRLFDVNSESVEKLESAH